MRSEGEHATRDPRGAGGWGSAGGSQPPTLIVGGPEPGGHVVRRAAVRAIASDGAALLLLRSSVRHALAFPGGGLEPDEPDLAALDRELREETGFRLVRATGEALVVVERRPAVEGPGAVFEMVSRYFWCEVADSGHPPGPDASERALGLAPEWVPLAEAIEVNRRVLAGGDAPPWTARELAVLEWLDSSGRGRAG